MKAGGGPKKPRSGKALTRKPGMAAKTARAKPPRVKAARVSGVAKSKAARAAKPDVERLALELQEARERQAATSEVLSLIADSPADLQPVFERIVKNAARLCQSVLSAVYRRDGEHVDIVAYDQFSAESVA